MKTYRGWKASSGVDVPGGFGVAGRFEDTTLESTTYDHVLLVGI